MLCKKGQTQQQQGMRERKGKKSPRKLGLICSRKKIRKRGSNRERKLRLPRRMRQNDRRRNYILIDS